MEFLGEIAIPESNSPPETPKGLQNIQTELAQIASAFGKICTLNRMVYGPYYRNGPYDFDFYQKPLTAVRPRAM